MGRGARQWLRSRRPRQAVVDDRSGQQLPARLREHDRKRSGDPQPDALPGPQRRAGVRGRHGLLVLGTEQQSRPAGHAVRPARAAGDGQSARRHGNPAGNAAIRTRPCDRVDRPHRADLHHLGAFDGQLRRHDNHHRHRRRFGRRRDRRRRGLDRQRCELASSNRRRDLGLHLVAAGRRHLYDPLPGRRRQHQPGNAIGRAHGHRQRADLRLAVSGNGDARDRQHQRFGGGRARGQVPDLGGRHCQRHPLLQGKPGHRHAHRFVVVEHRHPAGDADVHERDGQRLADGVFLRSGDPDAGRNLYGLLPHQCRPLFLDHQLLHLECDERPIDGARQRQRRLCLW